MIRKLILANLRLFEIKTSSNSKQKIWTLGTMGQYFVTGRYAEWAKEELLDKNRRSVAFYRGITPTILTGNVLKEFFAKQRRF